MKEFATQFKFNNSMDYRLTSDLSTENDFLYTFVDEAYHELMMSKITYQKDGYLGGCFNLGNYGNKRAYFGGDYSKDLEPIMLLIDPNVVFVTKYPSKFDMIS